VQGQGGLSRLDGEQALSLEVEQVLLLELLDLHELLLEGQTLGLLLLLRNTHTHTNTHRDTPSANTQTGHACPRANKKYIIFILFWTVHID
jgi:hypothetical protein